MRVERDVEYPLRNFSQKKEVHNMQTIGSNLASIAKELEDAQDKSDRLARKGPRANAQKVDAAATRLSSATQQWESQAPFIFESLQVLDEQRVNQLRDLLTQLLTHESDQAQRTQVVSSDTVQHIIDLQTAKEVQGWTSKVTDGKTKVERKPAPGTRRSSAAETQSHHTPPATATTGTTREDEAMSETSAQEPPPRTSTPLPAKAPANKRTEPRLRSRIGTVFSRRRQSMHGGFGQLSQKNAPSFGRNLRSSHSGGGVSPRASANDLSSSNKLPSLAEMPNKDDEAAEPTQGAGLGVQEPTNGLRPAASTGDIAAAASSTSVNGNAGTIPQFSPPPGPPPSHVKAEEEPKKDAEGFTIPPTMDDPISQAQREAGGDVEQLFKLSIQNKPLSEDDAAAKAALSNVSSALQMGMPSRKGTVRGRRDVRNTIYVPSNGDGPESPVPPTPPMPSGVSKPPAVAALTSEASVTGTSDSQSVRSGNSLGTLAPARHPEMSDPGLNASIIETMTAAFEDGAVKRAKIGGEIAFCYNPEDQAKTRE